jgi:ubiquinone/menaquinone biosynthesis C-methylase UbiE
MKMLDIGCGEKKVDGAVGVDFNNNIDTDVVHDLNEFPYPFNADEFDKVYIKDTLMLLDNPQKVMEEIYRISKSGAEVEVSQPYFRSVWGHADPGIKSFGTVHSFAFYDPEDPICIRYKYSQARFSLKNVHFDEGLENVGLIKKLVRRLANRWPRKYELYFSHIFILDRITHHLIKL